MAEKMTRSKLRKQQKAASEQRRLREQELGELRELIQHNWSARDNYMCRGMIRYALRELRSS